MMPRWVGLLGSWALFVLGLGLASFAVAGEWINMRDSRRLDRVAVIDDIIRQRTGGRTEALRAVAGERQAEVEALRSRVQTVEKQTEDIPDTGQTIIISTTENRLYVRRNGQTIMETLVSTGKGTRLALDGKTLVFETPIGRFHIKSKEENPQWVPPDWHYAEEAQKNGMRVVHLSPGQSIDADTGERVGKSEGVWSWFGGGTRRVMKVRGDQVVIDEGGYERTLPPGKTIVAGNAIVVPPVSTAQRRYAEVLGRFRLNLGDGYALHGTNQPDKLGQSVSHGCVRVGDADLQRLYEMANVGDEVIIY